MSFSLPSLSPLKILPQKSHAKKLRLRPRAKSGATPIEDVTQLQTSFDVRTTLKALRTRRWRLIDLHHVATVACIVFSLSILPSAPLIKCAAMGLLGILLLMPVTQQFFLPSLPIWTYLLYFFSSR